MSVEIVSPGTSLEEKLAAAAVAIFDTLKSLPRTDRLTIGLCGGRSVVGLLGAIQAESKNQPRELFDRLEFFMVDERIVPLDDPQSNFGGLKNLLFDRLIAEGLLRPDQLHPFEATRETASTQCEKYGEDLRAYGGRFAVVVLGMGEDGHIAGLFPGHPILQERSESFVSFFDSPKPPPARMTAAPSLVLNARLGVLLALGEAKRDAWNKFRADGVSVERCPARMVLQLPRALVITDLDR